MSSSSHSDNNNTSKFTIPLLQRIFKFSCIKPRQVVELAQVNLLFHETIIAFRTASLILQRNFIRQIGSDKLVSTDKYKRRETKRDVIAAFFDQCFSHDCLAWVTQLAFEDIWADLVRFRVVSAPASFVHYDWTSRAIRATKTVPPPLPPLVTAIKFNSLDNISILMDFMVKMLNIGPHPRSTTDSSSSSFADAKTEENNDPHSKQKRKDHLIAYHFACGMKNSIIRNGKSGYYNNGMVDFLVRSFRYYTFIFSLRKLQLIVSKLDQIKPRTANHSNLVRKFFISNRTADTETLLMRVVRDSMNKQQVKLTGGGSGRSAFRPVMNDNDDHDDKQANNHNNENKNIKNTTTTTTTTTTAELIVEWILEESEKRGFLGDQLVAESVNGQTLFMVACCVNQKNVALYILEKFRQARKQGQKGIPVSTRFSQDASSSIAKITGNDKNNDDNDSWRYHNFKKEVDRQDHFWCNFFLNVCTIAPRMDNEIFHQILISFHEIGSSIPPCLQKGGSNYVASLVARFSCSLSGFCDTAEYLMLEAKIKMMVAFCRTKENFEVLLTQGYSKHYGSMNCVERTSLKQWMPKLADVVLGNGNVARAYEVIKRCIEWYEREYHGEKIPDVANN